MVVEDDKKHLEILRNLPTNKRLEAAFELYEFARSRVASEIRRQNPQIDESKLNRLLKERFCPHD